MNNRLNPCPICGGTAALKPCTIGHDRHRYMKIFTIECTECHLSTDSFHVHVTISDTGIVSAATKELEDNINKWNKRLGSNITEDGWIPIKTRKMTEDEKEEYKIKYGDEADECYACPLPEDEQDVLITTAQDSVLLTTFYENSNGVYFADYDGFIDIKAWKPLPKPYKENDENELSTVGKEI